MENSQHSQQQQLPPIKATEPGRGKRKHTLAPARLNSDTGQVEIHLLCVRPECGCSGWFALEDLVLMYEAILRLRGEEKEKAA